MSRKYRVRMGEFDIDRWEYQEVEALARRYKGMKARADVLEKCRATGVHGEQYATIRWECGIVERALRETANGEWEKALYQVCCEGKTYEDVDPVEMPTSRRNEFFRARREFYWRLWRIRQEALAKAAKLSSG